MNNETVIAVSGLLLGVFSTLAGLIVWLQSAAQKRYAAERDFQHIKTSIAGLSTNLAHELDSQENQLNVIQKDLVEIKTLMVALLAQSSETRSGILRREPQRE